MNNGIKLIIFMLSILTLIFSAIFVNVFSPSDIKCKELGFKGSLRSSNYCYSMIYLDDGTMKKIQSKGEVKRNKKDERVFISVFILGVISFLSGTVLLSSIGSKNKEDNK